VNNIKQPYPFQNPLKLTNSLLVLLYIGVALSAISILDSLISYNLYSSAQYIEISDEDVINNDIRAIVIGVLAFLFYLAAIIVFLIWLHRANKNSRALGAQDMQFTPDWCIGWWFIPIASLWKPYQAVREIWKTSQDTENWQNKDNSIVALWWTLWIISSIVGQIIYRWGVSIWSSPYSTWMDYQNIELAYIFIAIFDIVLTFVFIKVIKDICNGQLAQFYSKEI
tara:strand:+ start:307 stop:981 length:675 start_codon:yes stop_codon:yes gene_type:complete